MSMNILAIETTGFEASVAVINEQEEVFEETSSQKLSHLQNLMPMVDQLLSKCGLTIDDMTYIAASEGPGSFTGIRIGVSSARALAQALGRKTISVPTLQSFAYHVPEYRGVICPIFDARRSQVYGGAYQWQEDGSCREVISGGAYDLGELLQLLEQLNPAELTFFGDGISPYEARIREWEGSSSNDNIRLRFAEADKRLQKASSVAKLAYQLYLRGEIKAFNDLKPNYMRKAEAERKLEEKS